ncbi:MAG: GLPGLI family protein [Chitinophagaceae bacterium]|nr:GLPGLI family protein [Chitinophagaceae bacterium]
MTKYIAVAALAIVSLQVNAQQNEGKIIYTRTTQMQIRIAGGNNEMENLMPRTRTDKFELNFVADKSMWKQMEPEEQEATSFGAVGDGGTMQIRTFGSGGDDVMFSNLAMQKRIELRELGTKKFIVDDSIVRLNWKLSDETKLILGHTCRKAVSQRISTRMMMSMEDGKTERKEVADTANIIAWFATDIPVSTGPGEYQAQLPGAVLEIDVNNGRSSFKAIEINPKADIAVIKEPKGSKRISSQEYVKERNKLMEEMGRNNAGPGRTIRIAN